MAKYKYVGNKNKDNYTEAIVLERNATGDTTKAIGVGDTCELTDEQVRRIREFAVLEQVAGNDVADKKSAKDK